MSRQDLEPDDQEKEYVPPALFTHCVNTYEEMLRRAKLVYPDSRPDKQHLDPDPQDADTMVVYEGPLTQLITGDLHLSVPYYTSVTRALKRMGCIRQLRRGGGSAESQWELIQEPTVELFRADLPVREHKPDRYAMLAQQIEELRGQVNELLKFRDAMVEYFGTQPVTKEDKHG